MNRRLVRTIASVVLLCALAFALPAGAAREFALKPGLSQTAYAAVAEGNGRVVIASCRPDEVLWELPGMNNGLFTHYLLEGLRGAAAGTDGKVGVLRLFEYVSERGATAQGAASFVQG